MSQVTPTRRQGAPGGGTRNRATRVVASTLGILAGLLGLVHGYLETRRGNAAPSGILIFAVGPPCQANRVWHYCFPAMTIFPNFFVTGVLTIIVSLIVIVWAAVFVQRKNGGLVLILLSIIQLLVGGGLISPFFVSSLAWLEQRYRRRSPGCAHISLFTHGACLQRCGCGL